MLLLVLPLCTFALLWAMFAQGVPRDLPTAVCDLDNSPLSRRLVRMIDAAPTVRVSGRVSDPEQGKDMILKGHAYALVVLPEGLERQALRRTPRPVVCYCNNQFLLAASLVNRDVRKAVGTLSAGLDVRFRQARSEMPEAAMARREPIVLDSHVLFNPYLNYAYFLESSLFPTMLQIFILITTVYALGVELKEGTAREWLECAGKSPIKGALGKLAPYTAAFFLLAVGMNLFLFEACGIPSKGSVALVLWASLLFVLAYQAVGLILVTSTSQSQVLPERGGVLFQHRIRLRGNHLPQDGDDPACTHLGLGASPDPLPGCVRGPGPQGRARAGFGERLRVHRGLRGGGSLEPCASPAGEPDERGTILGEAVRRLLRVWWREYRGIFSDAGAMLVLFGAVVVYPIAYPLPYFQEVLRDVPVAGGGQGSFEPEQNTREDDRCQ